MKNEQITLYYITISTGNTVMEQLAEDEYFYDYNGNKVRGLFGDLGRVIVGRGNQEETVFITALIENLVDGDQGTIVAYHQSLGYLQALVEAEGGTMSVEDTQVTGWDEAAEQVAADFDVPLNDVRRTLDMEEQELAE